MPSVVYVIANPLSPESVDDIVTFCVGPYEPATGEKVGVATKIWVAVKFTLVRLELVMTCGFAGDGPVIEYPVKAAVIV